ncbi:MAG TPA: energy-coupling factor ABC transporter ATP-binding protein, partial [Firmicutes bacterium]|nr:energy-coupling factor ABC transporter ATP-binding protein [Bacillota bacterium]
MTVAAQIPVVRVERLTFSYDGSTDVLHELTVTLTPGDFLVVLGANGAGKSTLCYLLSGIIPHIYAGRRRGAVLVDGLDPWEHPMYAIAGHAGIVLQDPETQLFMPNLEMELGFGPANLGVPREEIRQRTERFLHLVGLDGFQRRSSKALSGGQKQRAALASVLTMLPRVLVLDEPTSQLDPVGSQEVVAALRNLARSRETTVVMTTHKVDEVVGIATHCLVLREGHAVRQGAFEEVVQDVDTLEEAGVQAPASYRVRRLLGRAAGEARLAGAATVTETAWVGDTATVTDTPRPGTADA